MNLSEFSVQNKIVDEPTFAWWFFIPSRRMAGSFQKSSQSIGDRTHKYRIKIPKSVEEAIEIDNKNGNHL